VDLISGMKGSAKQTSLEMKLDNLDVMRSGVHML
jgi:hypothetical protein